MTGLLLAMLGASILSGNTSLDRIEATQDYIDYTMEQQKIQEQKDVDQQKILEENFQDGFIAWLGTLHTIKYRLGHFDPTEKKFDCVGLFKGYAVLKGLLSKEEASYINSTVMYLLGKPKTLSQAKRGDITYRSPLGDETLKHIAIITRNYNPKEGGLRIYDNAPGNGGKVQERFLRMRGDIFVGRWQIKIASNPFIQIAKHKGLEYSNTRHYEGYYAMSRYYAPQLGQKTYLPYAPTDTYAEARDMNCGRPKEYDLTTDTCSHMAHKKTEYTDKNKVLACPSQFAAGQVIKIVDDIGYERLVKCQDRGGSIKGKRLDLFAGIGEEGLLNIKNNVVPGGSQHVYTFNLLSKPINEQKTTLHITDSAGHFAYIQSSRKQNKGTK